MRIDSICKRLGVATLLLNGIHKSLVDAGNFARGFAERKGQQVGSPGEVVFDASGISRDNMRSWAARLGENAYNECA